MTAKRGEDRSRMKIAVGNERDRGREMEIENRWRVCVSIDRFGGLIFSFCTNKTEILKI